MSQSKKIDWKFVRSIIYEQVITMGLLFGLFAYFALDKHYMISIFIGLGAMIADLLLLTVVFRRRIFVDEVRPSA